MTILLLSNCLNEQGAVFNGSEIYLIMEYMPGENLYSLLESSRSAQFGWNRLGKRIILDIAKAVVYLHSIGIIRKPPSTLLTSPSYTPEYPNFYSLPAICCPTGTVHVFLPRFISCLPRFVSCLPRFGKYFISFNTCFANYSNKFLKFHCGKRLIW
jgi:serine/threonine protein kinase